MSSEQDVLTIAEAVQEYPDEWVAMKVSERDSNGQPLAGIVVWHERDKRSLRTNTLAEKDLCIFFAGSSQLPVMV